MKRILLAAAVAGVTVAIASCSVSTDDRVDDLNKQYELGKQQRALAIQHGTPVDEKSCADYWVTSGAKEHREHGDKDWSYEARDKGPNGLTYDQQRQRFFTNGCMNRPAGATPPPTSPASISASPSLG